MDKIVQHLEAEGNAYYRVNSLFIRLPASNAFLTDDNCPAEDVAIFIHEYLHYLQNVATLYGLQDFVLQMRASQLFIDTLDADRKSKGPESLSAQARHHFEEHTRALGLLRGDRTPSASDFLVFKQSATKITIKSLNVDEAHVDVGSNIVNMRGVDVQFCAEINDEADQEFNMQFGAHCICEGVAWESERLLLQQHNSYRESHRAALVPYEVMRAVYEFHSGGEAKAKHLICAGTLALQSGEPGWAFVQICRALQEEGFPSAEEKFPSYFIERARPDWGVFSAKVLDESLHPLVQQYQALPPVALAIEGIEDLFKRYLALRIADPYFEFAYLESDDAIGVLGQLLHEKPPCPILQMRPNGKMEYTLFDKEAANSDAIDKLDARVTSLGMLQAMNSFTFAHQKADGGFVSTATIEAAPNDSWKETRVSCPHFGACDAPQASSDPERCRFRPWTSPHTIQGRCWYALAVATVGKSAMGKQNWPCLSGDQKI